MQIRNHCEKAHQTSVQSVCIYFGGVFKSKTDCHQHIENYHELPARCFDPNQESNPPIATASNGSLKTYGIKVTEKTELLQFMLDKNLKPIK